MPHFVVKDREIGLNRPSYTVEFHHSCTDRNGRATDHRCFVISEETAHRPIDDLIKLYNDGIREKPRAKS